VRSTNSYDGYHKDDILLTSTDSNIIAVVYCSSSNLNEELLNNGYVELDVQQCATSEFANEPWVKDRLLISLFSSPSSPSSFNSCLPLVEDRITALESS
jgi:hypothetical protein